MVLGIDADAIAIGCGPVSEHDPANAKPRRCRKVLRRAAVVIDERRHERASPNCNACVTTPILRTDARHTQRLCRMGSQ